jgi:flagellar basal-body rod protein FlgG
MVALAQISAGIISEASRSLDVSSQNLVNASTPGYKRRVEFRHVLAANSGIDSGNVTAGSATDFAPGKLVQTGNPCDLAIVDAGFFVARAPSGALLYLRGGQFHRDPAGRLVLANGLALQADGGDLTLKDGAFQVLADGVVTQAGEPVGRLDIVDFADRQALGRDETGAFTAQDGQASAVDRPVVKQGVIEASNVTTAGEMVSMMAALRRAETGQRLMSTYDDLIGRVLTTFGQP